MGEVSTSIWRKLAKLYRLVVEPWRGSSHPLELRRAIFGELEQDIVEVGQGRRVYPYTHLRVWLLAETSRERAILEASFGHEIELPREICLHLEEQGCSVSDLSVEVAITEDKREIFGDQRFSIEKTRQVVQGPALNPGSPVMELTVVKGKADQEIYTFDQDRILIGRLREVTDEHGRLRRYNDLAFTEEGEESLSVSREQARIERRGEEIYIVDDRSAGGTRIFRQGRPIAVSSRDRRGILLKSEDLILLGRAAVRFEVREADSGSEEESPPLEDGPRIS